MALTIVRRGGSIFYSHAGVRVDPSNCVGVKGAGLSLAFKNRYRDQLMRPFQAACRSGELRPGKILAVPVYDGTVICLPTKDDWRGNARLEWIESGMAALTRWLYDARAHSVAIPALGCGRGELMWEDVYPLIEAGLAPARQWKWNLLAEIYEPR